MIGSSRIELFSDARRKARMPAVADAHAVEWTACARPGYS
jgi:hypothetical protein